MSFLTGFETEDITKKVDTIIDDPKLEEQIKDIISDEVEDDGNNIEFWFEEDDLSTEDVKDVENVVEVEKQESPLIENNEKEWWELASEKTGISAKNEADYIKKVSSPKVVKTDDVIDGIDNYLKMNDNDLVLEEYKDIYGDLAQRKIKKMDDEDIEIEATRIRSGLKQARDERVLLKQKTELQGQAEAKTLQDKLEVNVKETLLNTQKLFDMKVGKDDSDILKWSKSMEQYILSGKVIQEVQNMFKKAQDGNAQELIEFAQLMKSKDKIFVGMKNKGNSDASKNILDELRNSSSRTNSKGESPDMMKNKDVSGW